MIVKEVDPVRAPLVLDRGQPLWIPFGGPRAGFLLLKAKTPAMCRSRDGSGVYSISLTVGRSGLGKFGGFSTMYNKECSTWNISR